MATDAAQKWESGHVSDPMDFPRILFRKLEAVLNAPHHGNQRDEELRDLEAVLAPYEDDKYRRDLESIGKARRLRSPKDTTYQTEWLASIMRLMKRRKILGEEWVRG